MAAATLGAIAVAHYFKIEDECAQAVRLKLLSQQDDVSQPHQQKCNVGPVRHPPLPLGHF
jgi:hypothetical protein